MNRRVARNVAVVTEAKVKGRAVRFTYTNRRGEAKRRTVVPNGFWATKDDRVVLSADDTDGTTKTFLMERAYRATVL